MLRRGKKSQSLAGKLLLSTALVGVTLAYGWWQRDNMAGPNMAAAPMSLQPAANSRPPARGSLTITTRVEPVVPPTKAKPDVSVTPTAPAARLFASPPTLTALAALRMYQPPPLQPPLPLVTSPLAPGAAAPAPLGTHLHDGDYLSDTQQFEWGDLQVKISIHGGQITGAQIMQYPDHRAESLQISQMASPILDSELIKTQQSKVDIVSSATETSYVYRDAVANAIMKATGP
jgi:uncharacterized protein with FMN-binding domain